MFNLKSLDSSVGSLCVQNLYEFRVQFAPKVVYFTAFICGIFAFLISSLSSDNSVSCFYPVFLGLSASKLGVGCTFC